MRLILFFRLSDFLMWILEKLKIHMDEGSHLFVQSGFNMQRFVWHEKVSGGFDRGGLSLALRSKLDLSDQQLHCAPVEQRKETRV